MGIWFVKGDTSIGYWKDPDRKKPVFGISKGNVLVGYGQFHDEESAAEFMEELSKFFGIGGAEDGK